MSPGRRPPANLLVFALTMATTEDSRSGSGLNPTSRVNCDQLPSIWSRDAAVAGEPFTSATVLWPETPIHSDFLPPFSSVYGVFPVLSGLRSKSRLLEETN